MADDVGGWHSGSVVAAPLGPPHLPMYRAKLNVQHSQVVRDN